MGGNFHEKLEDNPRIPFCMSIKKPQESDRDSDVGEDETGAVSQDSVLEEHIIDVSGAAVTIGQTF